MILLITSDEVVTTSFVESKNFTRSKIKETQIDAAQFQWIKPVLGKEFYDSLLGEVNSDSFTGENESLLNDYIKPCLAYYVKFVVMPDIMLQLSNKGGQKAHSEFSTTISASERGEKRETAKRTADTLREKLVEFLNDNENEYPLYRRVFSKGKKKVRGGVLLRRRKRCNCDNYDCNYCNNC